MQLRIFFGAYSVICATMFGITPPMPRPAMKRITLKVTGSLVKPAPAVKTLNRNTQIEIVQRRPIRSDSAPRKTAPNIMPNSAELAMKPAVGGGDTHLLHDRRQRRPGDGDVVAIDHDDEQAPGQNLGVEAVERGLVDQVVNVDAVHGMSPRGDFGWWSDSEPTSARSLRSGRRPLGVWLRVLARSGG